VVQDWLARRRRCLLYLGWTRCFSHVEIPHLWLIPYCLLFHLHTFYMWSRKGVRAVMLDSRVTPTTLRALFGFFPSRQPIKSLNEMGRRYVQLQLDWRVGEQESHTEFWFQASLMDVMETTPSWGDPWQHLVVFSYRWLATDEKARMRHDIVLTSSCSVWAWVC